MKGNKVNKKNVNPSQTANHSAWAYFYALKWFLNSAV